MKRFFLLLLVAALVAGCAASKAGKPGPGDPAPDDPQHAALKHLVQAIEAQKKGDEAKAREAFGEALKKLEGMDRDSKAVMASAAGKLRNVAEISGFEYAPRESFNLLITYLEMSSAVMDSDGSELSSLDLRFNTAYQEVQQKTATEKQRRLEELGTEIAQKRDEIQKQAEPALLETYPSTYVVRKGDTLPSIAARHDIYNDSFMWPLIYKANRDQIKDPRVLYAGQDLKIPRDIGSDEVVDARKEAGAPDPEKIPKDAYAPRGKKK